MGPGWWWGVVEWLITGAGSSVELGRTTRDGNERKALQRRQRVMQDLAGAKPEGGSGDESQRRPGGRAGRGKPRVAGLIGGLEADAHSRT
jgi:hypothetical protein